MKKNFVSKDYFGFSKINPVIKFLTLTDVIIIGSIGLISPIFAVFVTDELVGGSVEVVGIAEMIFLLTSSLFQVPVAFFIDKIKGEKDDFIILFFGTFLISFIFFLYMLVKTPLQLYAVQFLYGTMTAFSLPSWYAIFTRHIDKKHEGIEWGVYKTLTTLATAFTAGLSGFVAYEFGFNTLFLIVGLISIMGSLFLLFVSREFLKK